MLSSLLADTAVYYEGWETVCPVSAPFFGFMGIASAVIFANLVRLFFMFSKRFESLRIFIYKQGGAYGTAKSGVGLASMVRFLCLENVRNGARRYFFFFVHYHQKILITGCLST